MTRRETRMLANRLRSLFALLVHSAVLFQEAVHGRPDGAAACPGGVAAVGGQHLDGSPITGSLDDGYLIFDIDNYRLFENDTFYVEPGEHYIRVSNTAFRGVLFRTDGDVSLDTSDEDMQIAEACTSVGAQGVTHTNSTIKASAMAYFVADVETSLTFDITVVIDVDPSEYYYSQYSVRVLIETPEPTPSPANSMSLIPTFAETSVTDDNVSNGGVGPTSAPTTAPTPATSAGTQLSETAAPSATQQRDGSVSAIDSSNAVVTATMSCIAYILMACTVFML